MVLSSWPYLVSSLVLIALIHPGRFSVSFDPHVIHEKDLISSLVPLPDEGQVQSKCPLNLDQLSNPGFKPFPVEQGGGWSPPGCIPQFHSVLVISYRDRPDNLDQFLKFMHPFLQRQNLSYDIFVIEQSPGLAFNRAKLFNIGFREALKATPEAYCFIFHDVDLLPMDARNIYACTRQPRHMTSHLDKFRYNLPYHELFGGGIAILKEQFQAVNGFSNRFFGWGGEDDDLSQNRVSASGYQICRFPGEINRYQMLSHKPAQRNADNYRKFKAAGGSDGDGTMLSRDGLNDLMYTVLARTREEMYTNILVDLSTTMD